ncbi:RAMP superfamily protein [Streptococcus oralis subsp. dentisani]|uniref:RAMP superfamily protein n=1 Tax=Streptococcus oralis subsp. dentisani TaxID=1458253 RepID=A0A3R9KL87_STROR|nr:RAMP superfamily CRISPR-associated protein [Streptococcus oralis]RSJ70712.1 RAMP superfamily protein [Streptococcus oralis subsp. dentisani]
MKAKIFVIECLTNLHVGNGDVNFNIIDNEVERDVVTGFPTINSSGVKGALRAFFEENKLLSNINGIFGSDENGSTTSGALKFLSANLLALPIRSISGGDKPYSIHAPKTACEDFNQMIANFQLENVSIADMKGGDEKITLDADNSCYERYGLPVIARNSVGEKTNLWYEEVVPHKSIFYFAVVASTSESENLLEIFTDSVREKIIQFGANASVGYGLCKVIKVISGNEEGANNGQEQN